MKCEDLYIYYKKKNSKSIFKGESIIKWIKDGLQVNHCDRVYWFNKDEIDYFEFSKKVDKESD